MAFVAEPGRLDLPLPLVRRVRQVVEAPTEPDVVAAVRREMAQVTPRVVPGMSVAVAVGSRGIADIGLIVRTVIDELRAAGVRPFIVPAMGSHGGGTPDGQLAVLAGYGITSETMGVPIEPAMDTVILGEVDGVPIRCSRVAMEADAVVPINRVKVHTSFHGPVESGLAKMLVIGLGKHAGAAGLHRVGTVRFDELIPRAVRLVLARCRVTGGLAVLENAREQVAAVEFVPAAEMLRREPVLLERSRSLMARLPFGRAHVLVVDHIGKDVSGDGMDPNITGRHATAALTDPERDPDVIAVLRLTARSHGNACGVGLADVTTRAVVDAMDRQATWTNVVTSGEPALGRIPLWTATDREAVALALSLTPWPDPASARLVRVSSTLDLEELWVSEALWQAEGLGREDVEPLSGPEEMAFTPEGRLSDLE